MHEVCLNLTLKAQGRYLKILLVHREKHANPFFSKTFLKKFSIADFLSWIFQNLGHIMFI